MSPLTGYRSVIAPGRILTTILGLSLLVAGIGCGDDVSSSANVAGSTPTETAQAAASPATTNATETSAFPVTIEHEYGSTEILEQPERVIALGYNEQDALLALGVKPIAVRYWFGDEPFATFPWAQDQLGDHEPVVLNMPAGELDFEAIAALEPDLISGVYSGITEEEYQTLSAIAPTTTQTSGYIAFGMPWSEATLLIGESIGKKAEAERMVADLEAEFASVREAHPEWQDAFAAVVAPRNDGQVGIFATGDLRSQFFAALGFKVPEEFDEIAGGEFVTNVSLERADLLDQDLIVFHQLSYLEGGQAAVESNPLWSKLNALKEGRAIFLNEELDSAFAFNSVLSIDYFMDGVVPLIDSALDWP